MDSQTAVTGSYHYDAAAGSLGGFELFEQVEDDFDGMRRLQPFFVALRRAWMDWM